MASLTSHSLAILVPTCRAGLVSASPDLSSVAFAPAGKSIVKNTH